MTDCPECPATHVTPPSKPKPKAPPAKKQADKPLAAASAALDPDKNKPKVKKDWWW